jgi:hypothetical protein
MDLMKITTFDKYYKEGDNDEDSPLSGCCIIY